MMLAGRLQILADGQEIDLGGTQVVHELQHLVALFAEPDHDPRLGEHRRVKLLHALEQAQRMKIAGARPHREVARGHGFEIVVEHVRPGRDHGFKGAVLAQEIRGQHLDRRTRAARADGADRVREMLRPAVVEVVAVDGGNHDMRQAERGGGLRHMLGLGGVERPRQARAHVTEGAGARAGVAHDHEGGVLLIPAFADIRAAGLLAHRMQSVGAHDGVGLPIAA